MNDQYSTKPKIVVLGVGGAGCNAIDNLINAGVGKDVSFEDTSFKDVSLELEKLLDDNSKQTVCNICCQSDSNKANKSFQECMLSIEKNDKILNEICSFLNKNGNKSIQNILKKLLEVKNNSQEVKNNNQGVKFVSCNTDRQALELCNSQSIKIQIGPKTTRGLGAGADPRRGAEAAQESMDEIVATFADAHMLFITAGAGGGTGSGAAPEIAQAARKQGILTLGFIVKPFEFEGTMRARTTEESIAKLQANVDCLIIVQNQNLLFANNPNLTIIEGFKQVDEVLCNGVAGIVNIITQHGLVNVDFQDVLKIMKNRMSRVVFGVGKASGEGAAVKAAEMSLSNPLLEVDMNILQKVDSALISITGGKNLTIDTIRQSVEYLRDKINNKSDNLILGVIVNNALADDAIEICIFGTCPKTDSDDTNIDKQSNTQHNNANIQNILNKIAASEDVYSNEYIGSLHGDLQEERKYEYNSNNNNSNHNNQSKSANVKPAESVISKPKKTLKWW